MRSDWRSTDRERCRARRDRSRCLRRIRGRERSTIGVVEAQDEAPARAPGEEPVEQRGARVADVDAPGRRGREADGRGRTAGTACAFIEASRRAGNIALDCAIRTGAYADHDDCRPGRRRLRDRTDRPRFQRRIGGEALQAPSQPHGRRRRRAAGVSIVQPLCGVEAFSERDAAVDLRARLSRLRNRLLRRRAPTIRSLRSLAARSPITRMFRRVC